MLLPDVLEADSLRLYLIRHGETDYNTRRIVQGYGAVPLNAAGVVQTRRLAEKLGPVRLDHIYASDLHRAAMTAEILAENRDLEVEHSALLRERNPGLLTEKTYDEARAFFEDLDYEPPEGESVTTFLDRVRQAGEWLVDRETGRDRHVAVVTHGMFCRAFVHVAAGVPAEELEPVVWRNTCVSVLEHGSGWKVHALGDATHLEDADSAMVDRTGA